MKPSEKIAAMAYRHIYGKGIEGPGMWDFMSAIMEYLDEEHSKQS